MKTDYSHVKIPLNTVLGGTVQALSTRAGTKLTRVTEDGRDDLVVQRPGKPTVHLAWSQVKGGIVEGTGTAWVRPVEPPADVVEEEAVGEPVDDTVRLTKPRPARGRKSA